MPKHALLLLVLHLSPLIYALPTPEQPPQISLSPGSIAAICCIGIILMLILILLFITRRVFLIHRQLDISRSIIENDTRNGSSQFSNKSGLLVGLLGSPAWESQVSGTVGKLSAENTRQTKCRRPSDQSHTSQSYHGSMSSRGSTSQRHHHQQQQRKVSVESERSCSITRPQKAHTSSSSRSSHRSHHSHSRRSTSLKRTSSQPKRRSVSFDDPSLRLISFSLEDMQHPPLPLSSEHFTLPMLQASSPLSPLNVYEAAFRHTSMQKQQDLSPISRPYALGKQPKSPGAQDAAAHNVASSKENLDTPVAPFFTDVSGDESQQFIADTPFSPPLTSTPRLSSAVLTRQQARSKSLRTRRTPSWRPSPLRNTIVADDASGGLLVNSESTETVQELTAAHSSDVLDIIKALVNETANWDHDLFVNDDFKTLIARERKGSTIESSPSQTLSPYPSMELYDGTTWFDLPEIDESPEYELEEEKSIHPQPRYSPLSDDGQSVVGVAR